MKIKWLDKGQKHDPAAESYMSLTMDSPAAKIVVTELENAGITKFAAKDIFRASGLSFRGVSNSHVEKDHARIMRGEELSPLMLCRDKTNRKLKSRWLSPALRSLQIR
jgi:hypothetical protein